MRLALFERVAMSAAGGRLRAAELLRTPLATGLRCYEVSALLPSLEEPGAEEVRLPAPVCWLESVWPEVGRAAFLLIEGSYPVISLCSITLSPLKVGPLIALALEDMPETPRAAVLERQGMPPSAVRELVALLAAIAAPSTRRRVHRPPLGLGRRLRRAGLLPVGVPLAPWVEIAAAAGAAPRQAA